MNNSITPPSSNQLINPLALNNELTANGIPPPQASNIVNQSIIDQNNGINLATSLSNQGVANATQIAQAVENQPNPLAAATIGNQPLTLSQLGTLINGAVLTSLTQPGANVNQSVLQANSATSLLLSGPNSVLSLLTTSENNYQSFVQQSTAQTQSDQATQQFQDSLASVLSPPAFYSQLFSTANLLVYLDKPAYAGFQGKHAQGGAPSGFGYLQSTSDTPV